MLTLKKMALLGTAGLAAFAMSCSDTDGTDAGGTITGLTVAAGTLNTYVVTGAVAAAEDGNSIVSVALTADKGIVSPVTVTGTPATLALNQGLEPVCVDADKGKTITITVTAVVKFVSGDDATETATQTHACPAGGSNPALEGKTIQVGGSGTVAGSFVDLDPTTPVAYKQADFVANIAKIDIIYAFSYGGGDKIFSTMGAALGDTDLTTTTGSYSVTDTLLAADLEDYSEIYALTAAQKATVLAATDLADVADIPDTFGENEDESVAATDGAAFAVWTTEGAWAYVIITAKNTTVDITIKVVK